MKDPDDWAFRLSVKKLLIEVLSFYSRPVSLIYISLNYLNSMMAKIQEVMEIVVSLLR